MLFRIKKENGMKRNPGNPKISREPTIRADSPLRRYCRRYHRKNCRPQA